MSLIFIGEASAKGMDNYAAFPEVHLRLLWCSGRGICNCIALGYFEINLDLVLKAVRAALPDSLIKLFGVRQATESGEP